MIELGELVNISSLTHYDDIQRDIDLEMESAPYIRSQFGYVGQTGLFVRFVKDTVERKHIGYFR